MKKINEMLKIQKRKCLNLRRGSEVIEVTLIVAISIVLVISIFYPHIVSLSKGVMNTLTDWFTVAVSRIGVI